MYFVLNSSRNVGLLNIMMSDDSNQHLVGLGLPWINTTDPSSVSIAEYREWYSHHSAMVGPNITDCSLEEEMNKVSIRYSCNSILYLGIIQIKVIICFKKTLLRDKDHYRSLYEGLSTGLLKRNSWR